MNTAFSNAVCERIGYYVYTLKNPEDGKTFYVGKGKDNRIFQHSLGALDSPQQSEKFDLINEIHKRGHQVEHYILRHGLTEQQALEIESACIDLLGLNNLSNAIHGHESWERGLKSTDEIVQYYDAKNIIIDEPTIIINVNRLYKRFMSKDDLYFITRHKWKVGDKRNTVKYAIASYRGLVREVYEVKRWNKVGDRWEFEGNVAPDLIRAKYFNQSLSNYIKKGGQNPIRYTF